MSKHSPIEVAAAMVFRDGKLLIAQRFQTAHLGGLWEFPGGKREPGESWPECLLRELREELEIDVRVGPLVEEIVHQYPEKTVHLKFFKCEWESDEPKAVGCADFRWVTRDELNAFKFPDADDAIVRKLKTNSSLWQNERL